MKRKDDKGCLKVRSTHKYRILLIFTISILLFGCFEPWYPIVEDWLCTININGTSLKYVREDHGYFFQSPDFQTLLEFWNNKIYSVDINNPLYKTLLIDFGVEPLYEIDYSYFSNTMLTYRHDREIYTLDINSKDTTRLTFNGEEMVNWAPTISYDETLIAYSTSILDSQATIVLMNSDGTDKRTIVEYSAVDTSSHYTSTIVLWNLRFVRNDSILIYIFSGTTNIQFPNGIYSVSIDGSDKHCIYEDVDLYYYEISPNREFIFFIGNGYLHRINIDGSDHLLLAETLTRDIYPCVSPNGEKLFYTSDCFPYIINIDGTNNYKLLDKQTLWTLTFGKTVFFLNDSKILIELFKQIN